jgi:hypothetical protein
MHKDLTSQAHVYNFQGMLGRGLNVKPKGKYVAFAAGTGILVFLDLVAHIIMRIASENGGSKDMLAVMEAGEKLDLE